MNYLISEIDFLVSVRRRVGGGLAVDIIWGFDEYECEA